MELLSFHSLHSHTVLFWMYDSVDTLQTVADDKNSQHNVFKVKGWVGGLIMNSVWHIFFCLSFVKSQHIVRAVVL